MDPAWSVFVITGSSNAFENFYGHRKYNFSYYSRQSRKLTIYLENNFGFKIQSIQRNLKQTAE